ncbi:uncharacterized protein BKA55DRAFT_692067 [Fusarium redolens]|uniref:Uncharacterized protein n=1 Tax=Fusarium redolens TaxID=48865 RepID=A0A9P9K144_FUSRE|nr:uncharacterized protein BKA55DRAFT_692067 [Fusarium redolens]KAH7244258.1 hypothetical protein BKA55DRAFT_692067 [Fusarium redolens]
MPLNNYGVWKGKLKATSVNRDDYLSDHFYVSFDFDVDNNNQPQEYRACFNYRTAISESPQLVYWLIQDFSLPTVRYIEAFPRGWTEIIQLATLNHRQVSLDYLRGAIDYIPSGEENRGVDDIADYLTPFFANAIEKGATAYIYGELRRDLKEIHQIHMNQGSVDTFEKENAIRQDGGILLEFLDGH